MLDNNELIQRRVEQILPASEGLSKLLESGKKIRLYQGFDPTGGRLHLGHTVGMHLLNQFAQAGHTVFAVFGTGTVLVGDPSQRDTGRKLITHEEIAKNLETWKQQVEKIIDLNKVEIVFNGDWLIPLTLKEIIQIASNITAVQLFKRDSFQRRLDQGDTVWYHETMYPLLQGYDSVHLDVDLEIGGTDQTFNMLVGRELQKKMNNREKYVLTTPMIMGTDGRPMSKTSGNCIWLNDAPEDMYGKTMSISDEQIETYLRLFTQIPLAEIPSLLTDPLAAKKLLAFEIVKSLHSEALAGQAQANFENIVQQGSAPMDMPTVIVQTEKAYTILELCKALELGESNSEIKRMIQQGGVELNGDKLADPHQVVTLEKENILRYGKRNFIKIILD